MAKIGSNIQIAKYLYVNNTFLNVIRSKMQLEITILIKYPKIYCKGFGWNQENSYLCLRKKTAEKRQNLYGMNKHFSSLEERLVKRQVSCSPTSSGQF